MNKAITKWPILIAVLLGVMIYLGPISAAHALSLNWFKGNDIPTVRVGAVAALIGSNLYVAGGTNASGGMTTLEIYDSNTQSWSTGANMQYAYSGAASGGVINGKLYVAGIASGYKRYLQIYHPITDTWTLGTSTNEIRWSGTSGVIGSKLYVVGGSNEYGYTNSTLLIYDSISNSWSNGPSMPNYGDYGPYGMGSVVYQGKLYVVGGQWTHGSYSRMLVYDPASNNWSELLPILTARGNMATVLFGDKMYVMGGIVVTQTSDPQPTHTPVNTVEVYDFTSNTWTTGTPLPAACGNCWSVAVNGKIYYAGGDNPVLQTYSPDSGNPTSTPTQTPVPPTNTPIPLTSTPTPISGCQTVASVKVCADSFTSSGNGWTTTGKVQIGDYTTVENGNVTANGSALTGNGLVSMRTKADGSQLTALFRDSFDIASDSGVLTPKAVSGYEFKLSNLVGFSVQQNRYQLTLDVLKGQLSGSINLAIIIPRQNLIKTISFILDHNGAVSGSLADASFDLGRVTLNVRRASLSAAGFTIEAATLQLPPGLGGASAALSVNSARITGDGHFTLGGGSVTINFPNINVGGAAGFSINGAQTTLTINNDLYLFSGRGTFVLPGIGPGDGGCKIGTSFTFASAPPPVREASLSIDGCFKIPIASTGFFLTGVSGTVQLGESTVAIDLGIGVEGGPDIPNLGVAINGNPGVHWDNSWALGLNGTLKIFKFDAAEAALKLSKARGLEGQIHISLVGGIIDGSSSLHVWKDSSSFHFTGSALVQVKIEKGKIYHACIASVCVDIPPTTVQGPMASADFGEFRVGNDKKYGIKGSGYAFGYSYAFFVDALGNIKFDGIDQYQLVGSRQLSAYNDKPESATVSDIRRFTVGVNTPALLVELAVNNGAPILSLVTPNGQALNASSPGVITTTSLTQTLLTVANPIPGEWQIHVDNLTGGEQYDVVAFGARQAAVVAIPSVTDNGDGSYTIGVVATSNTPTSTISLFYDTSPISHTGQVIVQDLPLTTTTYRWQPDRIASGTYFIYAMVDDPLGAPAFAYGASPLTIHDSTPPAPPTDLRVSTLGSNAEITWQPSSTSDVAGYHVYYREPGGTTFVADIPNSQQSSYTQSGLYLNGGWEIAVSAYDLSGNESIRSAAVVATVYLNNIYLPLVLTNQ